MQVKIEDSMENPGTHQWEYQLKDMDGTLVDNGKWVNDSALSNNKD